MKLSALPYLRSIVGSIFLLLIVTGCESPTVPNSDNTSGESIQSETAQKNILSKRGSSSHRYKTCAHKNIFAHKRDCQRHDHDRNCEHNDDDEIICDEDGIVILWADKDTEVGTVTAVRQGNDLIITYATTGIWTLKETHLDLSLQQYSQRGAPGQYDLKTKHSGNVSSYSYTIPITWSPGTKIYLLAHASVKKRNGSTETAFAGTVMKPKNGAWYATFCYIIPGNPSPVTYSISGIAFDDANSNGLKDGSEAGLADVAVELSNGATTVSDENGAYVFTNIANGSYTVSAGSLSGYTQTTSSSVNITIAGSNATVDFGYAVIPPTTYQISGVIYLDLNLDGVYSAGDIGLSGITISLNNGTSYTTGAGGVYVFAGLTPATYSVTAPSIDGLLETGILTKKVSISTSNGTADFGYSSLTP